MDHKVPGGFTILLPCDIHFRVVLLRTCKWTGWWEQVFHVLWGIPRCLWSLWLHRIFPAPALLQPRAGQEPGRAQGLRLPWDRRHSLQRCPDLITSDTDSSETRLNLAVGLILKEALGACWEKQMFQLLFQHFMWIDRFPFPVAEPNPVPAAFPAWQISSTDRESSTGFLYL